MANTFGDPQWTLFGFKQRGFRVVADIVVWCDFEGFEKNIKVPRKVHLHGVAWGPIIFSWAVTLGESGSEPTNAQNEYFDVF